MTEETPQVRYRGVVCLYCRQPIAISERLANEERAARQAEETIALEFRSRVFILRCASCRKEAPYQMAEIEDLQGVPRARTSKARPVVVPWRHRAFVKAAG